MPTCGRLATFGMQLCTRTQASPSPWFSGERKDQPSRCCAMRTVCACTLVRACGSAQGPEASGCVAAETANPPPSAASPRSMSAFVPVNIPVAGGMVLAKATAPQLFWQGVNQVSRRRSGPPALADAREGCARVERPHTPP